MSRTEAILEINIQEGIRLKQFDMHFFEKYSDSFFQEEDRILFDDTIESMIRTMKTLLSNVSIGELEKLNCFVRLQCFECIRIFNLSSEKISPSDEFNFFIDFNIVVSGKIKEFYLSLFDRCIERGLFELSTNKELIFETIQDIIIYFIQTYYETKKISFSFEYVEEAINLLMSGVMKGNVPNKQAQVI